MAVDQLSSTFAALADPTRRAITSSRVWRRAGATVSRLAGRFRSPCRRSPSTSRSRARRADHARRGSAAAVAAQGAPLGAAAAWLEEYRRFWEGGFDRLEQRLRATEGSRMAEPTGRVTAGRGRIRDHPRPRRAARAGVARMDRAGALRGLVRRRGRGGCALHRLDGRSSGRHLARDNVRGPRAARSPVEGRVPRGGRGPGGSSSPSPTGPTRKPTRS